jgi:hypothetical protein
MKEKRLRLEQRRQIESAVKIQSAVRSFFAFSRYVITISDVIICQAVARRMLSKRTAAALRGEKKRIAEAVVSGVVVLQAAVRRQLAIQRMTKFREEVIIVARSENTEVIIVAQSKNTFMKEQKAYLEKAEEDSLKEALVRNTAATSIVSVHLVFSMLNHISIAYVHSPPDSFA